MAPLPDELVQPLAVIDALFARHAAQGGDAPAEWGERAHFVEAMGLKDEQAFARVPCLNDVACVEEVRPFTLVRYRCLVQDVFEPEVYAARFEERATGGATAAASPPRVVTSKYRECVKPAPGTTLHETEGGMSQRGACYCVPLPGESAWARSAAAVWGCPAGPARVEGAAAASLVPAPSKVKRARPGEDVEMVPDEPVKMRCGPAVRAARQALCPSRVASVTSCTAEEFGLNFPLPAEERRGQGASTACIVKLYDADADALRVCDAVEILGVLCVNPEMASFGAPCEDILGHDARDPSTALVPRLHALFVRKFAFYHPHFPSTPEWLSEARLVAAYQASFSEAAALAAARGAAIAQLAQHLAGDMVAAEYVLMLLVARSFGKHGDKSLGCFSLNLTKWPEDMDVRTFSNAAAELVPRAVCLEMTAQTLNGQRWQPRKDFDANRLVAAQLQLAPGTLLVLDETRMEEGQVTSEGVKSVLAVQTLVTEQKLACDFFAYNVHIPLELSCILVSRGRSIIKGVDAVVPLRPTSQMAGGYSSTQCQEADCLDAARLLVGLVTRRPKPLRIPDIVTEHFSEDFAAARADFEFSSELCDTWMCLARAHCLTHGDDELSLERWRTTLELERERLRRCQQERMFACAA